MSDRRKSSPTGFSIGRRQLLQGSGLVATAGLFQDNFMQAGQTSSFTDGGSNVYTRIGIRPLINCKGTFTIITGSLTLPEVKEATEEASRFYVHLDELMERVGQRLAKLTGAEWGIVTAGCSAAETLATCACVAGADPENIQRLPNLDGLKDEVVIPRYSRNVYDHAVRMVGVRMITVDNMAELEVAFGPRTAMVYVLACPEDKGPLGLQPIARVARRHGVSVFVDAAAENLNPKVHLERGADLVAYSGGKALRGPQCAGLLLGPKNLCHAAWLNSAPHHAFGRSLKVGKEEIMGMLAAVELWYRRDHAAEWNTWESWLGQVADRVEKVVGVTTEVLQPRGLSNYAPRLEVRWDGDRLGISGQDVYDLLLEGTPRIILARSRGSFQEKMDKSAVEIMPYMMHPGDATTVAQHLYDVLSHPPRLDRTPPHGAETARVAGRWKVTLDFAAGRAHHWLFLEQKEKELVGTHQGRTLSGTLEGRVAGNRVEFRSSQTYEGTRLRFHFQGELDGESLKGTVDLGEYGKARWTAYRLDPSSPSRP